MGLKDLYRETKPVLSIDVADKTAGENGTGVDTLSAIGAKVLVIVGAKTTLDASNSFQFTVEESDDDSTYAAIASGNYVGASWDLKLDLATDVSQVFTFGIKIHKQYVRVVSAVLAGSPQVIFGAYIEWESGRKPAQSS